MTKRKDESSSPLPLRFLKSDYGIQEWGWYYGRSSSLLGLAIHILECTYRKQCKGCYGKELSNHPIEKD